MADNLVVNLLQAKRSIDSGSYLMNGTDITVYEQSKTYPWEFLRGYVDLTTMAAGDTVVVTKRIKNAPGGAFVVLTQDTYNGAQAVPMRPIESELNVYGLQITIQQTAIGTYRALLCEFFDSVLGGDWT